MIVVKPREPLDEGLRHVTLADQSSCTHLKLQLNCRYLPLSTSNVAFSYYNLQVHLLCKQIMPNRRFLYNFFTIFVFLKLKVSVLVCASCFLTTEITFKKKWKGNKDKRDEFFPLASSVTSRYNHSLKNINPYQHVFLTRNISRVILPVTIKKKQF